MEKIWRPRIFSWKEEKVYSGRLESELSAERQRRIEAEALMIEVANEFQYLEQIGYILSDRINAKLGAVAAHRTKYKEERA